MAADGLLLDNVLASLASGEIIEQYPSDHPLPSCQVYGESEEGLRFTAFGPKMRLPAAPCW